MDVTNIWTWGLNEALDLQHNMSVEPAWDAEDNAAFLDEDRGNTPNRLRWLGNDEAQDLRFSLYGDHVLCDCGCGTLWPSADYDRWDFDHNRSHLDWLYGT